MSSDKKLKCSFCGRDKDEVEKFVSAPDRVIICDNCVMLAVERIRSSDARFMRDESGWLKNIEKADEFGVDIPSILIEIENLCAVNEESLNLVALDAGIRSILSEAVKTAFSRGARNLEERRVQIETSIENTRLEIGIMGQSLTSLDEDLQTVKASIKDLADHAKKL